MRKILVGTIVIHVLILIIFSTTSMADGNYLLKGCQEAVIFFDDEDALGDPGSGAGHCVGAVSAITDAMSLYNGTAPTYMRVCRPDEIPNIQGVRIVLKYLKNNPEKLHKFEAYLIMDAFFKAFPCK